MARCIRYRIDGHAQVSNYTLVCSIAILNHLRVLCPCQLHWMDWWTWLSGCSLVQVIQDRLSVLGGLFMITCTRWQPFVILELMQIICAWFVFLSVLKNENMTFGYMMLLYIDNFLFYKYFTIIIIGFIYYKDHLSFKNNNLHSSVYHYIRYYIILYCFIKIIICIMKMYYFNLLKLLYNYLIITIVSNCIIFYIILHVKDFIIIWIMNIYYHLNWLKWLS